MEFTTDSSARTDYVSKEFCTPEVEEESEEAESNPNGILYAVAVKTDVEIIVGNLLWQFQQPVFCFCVGVVQLCVRSGCRQASVDLPKGTLKAFVRCSIRGKS